MEWLSDMSKCEKDSLLKAARNGGRKLRQKHKENDKSVLRQINEENLLNNQKQTEQEKESRFQNSKQREDTKIQ